MPLSHVIADNQVPVAGTWASADSGLLVISFWGKTMMWSTGFSGCIGLVLCGRGQWGVLAHLNQSIQYGKKDLELALSTVSDFVSLKLNSRATDVFIYYGDHGLNFGQDKSLDPDKIKKVMNCERVIDRRRTSSADNYGSDFVYDPGTQTVYTLRNGTAGMALLDHTQLTPGYQAFPFKENTKELLTPGLGNKGWFSVP